MSRLIRVGLVVGCLVALAGCKVNADITVTMHSNGSGTIDTFITLDSEAAARVQTGGRTLATAFPLDDLKAAGWKISPWTAGTDGSQVIRLQHDYSGEKELTQRINELVGPTRLLRDPQMTRDHGIIRTHDELSLTADLRSPSAHIAQDKPLASSLQAAGLDVATLDQQLQSQLSEALTVSVTMQVPSGRESTVQVLAGEQQQATAARSHVNTARLGWFAIALLLAFLGVLLYLSASVGNRRERARETVQRPAQRSPLM